MPEVTKTLYTSDRKAWDAWLAKNHATEPEIWLVYYRKDTGKPRVSYNDAVEEALAFGWIDSTPGERFQEESGTSFEVVQIDAGVKVSGSVPIEGQILRPAGLRMTGVKATQIDAGVKRISGSVPIQGQILRPAGLRKTGV